MFGNNVLFYNAIKTKALSCLTHSLTLYIDTNTLNHRSKAGNIYTYLLNIYLPDTPSSWRMSGILPPCLALRAGCSCLKENIIWVACPLHVARDTRVLPDWGVTVGSLDNLHDSSRVKMVTIILGRSIFRFIFQIHREKSCSSHTCWCRWWRPGPASWPPCCPWSCCGCGPACTRCAATRTRWNIFLVRNIFHHHAMFRCLGSEYVH